MEILLRDGGIQLLLGPSGMGEGELKKYMMDWRSRQQFLLEAAHRCQEAGLYDKVSKFILLNLSVCIFWFSCFWIILFLHLDFGNKTHLYCSLDQCHVFMIGLVFFISCMLIAIV
jgi:hypothetical protein